MSEETVKSFGLIISEEQSVMDMILENQKLLRKAVLEKNWDDLVGIVEEINYLSDNFQQLDKVRDFLQQNLTGDELQGFTRKLSELRMKLSTSRIENKAIGDYVTITRGFINGVLDAIPQGRCKTYSRTGQIVQNQPTSVVLNICY